MASELAASAGIAEGFTHLLRLRASQLNQCAYCVRLHTRDALASGEPSDRISVLPAWRETQSFNDKERAAFALVETTAMLAMLVRAARFESMPGLQPMPVSRVVLVPQDGMPMRVTVRDGGGQ